MHLWVSKITHIHIQRYVYKNGELVDWEQNWEIGFLSFFLFCFLIPLLYNNSLVSEFQQRWRRPFIKFDNLRTNRRRKKACRFPHKGRFRSKSIFSDNISSSLYWNEEKLSLFSPHSQLQPFFLAFLVSGTLLLMAALCNQSITITELSSTPRVVPALSLYLVFSLRLRQAMADPSLIWQSQQMKCNRQVIKLNISIIICLHISYWVTMPFYAVNHNFPPWLFIDWLPLTKTSNHN